MCNNEYMKNSSRKSVAAKSPNMVSYSDVISRAFRGYYNVKTGIAVSVGVNIQHRSISRPQQKDSPRTISILETRASRLRNQNA